MGAIGVMFTAHEVPELQLCQARIRFTFSRYQQTAGPRSRPPMPSLKRENWVYVGFTKGLFERIPMPSGVISISNEAANRAQRSTRIRHALVVCDMVRN